VVMSLSPSFWGGEWNRQVFFGGYLS
jgi:hypothetical protein